MLQIKNKKDCCGCQACANICPKKCISMQPDEEGFLYPVIDTTKCINCGLCEKICPCLNSKKIDKPVVTYGAYCKDSKIVEKSSSGGMFTLIAKKIIDDGGVVFGVGFDENMKVVHKKAETLEEAFKFRTSKYVQSDIKDTYQQAKAELQKGRKVLFTGTPCQIEGLKAFLGKDYDNLYTQDLLCHGVPTPLMWEKYMEFMKNELNNKSKIVNANFRDKKGDWYMHLTLQFEDGQNCRVPGINDVFVRAFESSYILRPSCYCCKFRGPSKNSDITIADFWKVQRVCPEIFNRNGTSLVFIHSKKGQELFDSFADMIEKKQINYKIALKGNPVILRSFKKPLKRKAFMKTLREGNFIDLATKYLKIKEIRKEIWTVSEYFLCIF